MTQGILLVGGLGTRLLPLTRSVPKPMLPVAGLPVTEHQLMAAKSAGITSIVLAASYLSEVFTPYFGDGSRWGIQLQYAVENEPLGTGGAIRNAAKLLNDSENIAIFNGDVLSSHDLAGQIRMHETRDADVTLHLTKVSDARAYGCVPTAEDGRVIAFLEKMEKPVADTINAGCYIFNPRVLLDIPVDSVVSIERDTFPHLITTGRNMFGFIDESYWIDIGTPQTLLQGSTDVVTGKSHSSALDRLGVDHHNGEYVAMEGSRISEGVRLTGGTSIGKDVVIEKGAAIHSSIISNGAYVADGVELDHCFVAEGVRLESGMNYAFSYVGIDGVVALIAGK
jgi:mannose-1-phosphate guanylyltransferase